jgi:hypothetical protein
MQQQLTQTELQALETILNMESLAMRKLMRYQESCKEKELIPWMEQAIEMHRRHINEILGQIRNHDGREKGDQ